MTKDSDLFSSKPGFSGSDSMRTNAEKMFRSELDAAKKYNPPKSMSAPSNTRMRYYAKGGTVKFGIGGDIKKGLSKAGSRLKGLAKKGVATAREKLEPIARRGVATAKREAGASARNLGRTAKDIGMGALSDVRRGTPVKQAARGALGRLGKEALGEGRRMASVGKSEARREGQGLRKAAGFKYGGYAKGGAPLSYSKEMVGEKPVRQAKKTGGPAKKMAMGGVGKIRHKQATSAGKPITKRGRASR